METKFIVSFFSEFTKIYERLDITNLVDRGESFYQELMGEVVKNIEKTGEFTSQSTFIYSQPTFFYELYRLLASSMDICAAKAVLS